MNQFLHKAEWINPQKILVHVKQDWQSPHLPFFRVGEILPTQVYPDPAEHFGADSGYFIKDNHLVFCLPVTLVKNLPIQAPEIYLACRANNWEATIGKKDWKLKRQGHLYRLQFDLPLPFYIDKFKFVSAEGYWIPPSRKAGNIVWEHSIASFQFDPQRTGAHRFLLHLSESLDPLSSQKLNLSIPSQAEEEVFIDPRPLLDKSYSSKPLGTLIEDDKTTFRLFAPQVQCVHVTFFELETPDQQQMQALWREPEGTWAIEVPQNLENFAYFFYLSKNSRDHSKEQGKVKTSTGVHLPGLEDTTSTAVRHNFNLDDVNFGKASLGNGLVDPYARVVLSREGPGIITRDFPIRCNTFKTPSPENLVIVEMHPRDLLAKTELKDRQSFRGLIQWLKSPENYLKHLGINAIELQPVFAFDNQTQEEYHWGYMPIHFFAPAFYYADDPLQIRQDFYALVETFHQQNIAVILDVVYNHLGEKNALMAIDKNYYFHCDAQGILSNWSGCGNDFRTDTPMGQRLVLDSLRYWIRQFNVDGFRFDLAELLDSSLIHRIHKEIRELKPDVLLIAEPWSFRGHNAYELKFTSFSSWNDGFRDFMLSYVKGIGSREGLSYFLQGSSDFFCQDPYQSINYLESHDDFAWIDRLTENKGNNGFYPTALDRRRTHLAFALLFMSLGVPMLSVGQDFLRSKQGMRNTYLRGDLNALDYTRMHQFPATVEYVRRWIQFRRSEWGKLLRQRNKPPKSFFQFFHGGKESLGILYNADRSQGPRQLFFAINPHQEAVRFPDCQLQGFVPISNAECFEEQGLACAPSLFNLTLGPLSCGLWKSQ